MIVLSQSELIRAVAVISAAIFTASEADATQDDLMEVAKDVENYIRTGNESAP